MDGLSVLSAIKSDPAAKNIPVILLSGNAEVDAVKQGLMAGAVDYIVKPFAKADLIGRIEASLSRA
jgi:DNA-binding response OmpR family regulator